MNNYARLKGSATAPAAPASRSAAVPARELSDQEAQRVAENRAFVLEHLPELVPFIKDLHAEGLIDGWRAVRNCTLSNPT
ncbi:MAG: hypothetical protein HYU78_09620 [Rhodocyclales bacterium]|nr:hypothetical protein [Rhodocyclales bacterium]